MLHQACPLYQTLEHLGSPGWSAGVELKGTPGSLDSAWGSLGSHFQNFTSSFFWVFAVVSVNLAQNSFV